MSVSSATTLISPSAAAPSTTSTTNMQRSNSSHGHTHKSRHGAQHQHHAHHGRRRPSGHTAHTTGNAAGARRGSESDGGRKVAFAQLAMAALDQARQEQGKRRKSQEERPAAKSSKSDTALPPLTRTASGTSNTSAPAGGSRPRMKEKDSENSVVVVDDEGHEVEEEDDEEEGEWDDEESPVKTKDSKDKDPMSAAMRRTMSESVAAGRTQSPEEVGVQPASITSPVSVKKSLVDPPSLITRKTTGFTGALHPPPEPEPEPVEMPPLKRVQSVKELAAEAIEGERKITARKLAMMDQRRSEEAHEEGDRPGVPDRTRSTEGSGLPNGSGMTEEQKAKVQTSPSFPFPRVLGPEAAESSQMAQRSVSGMAPRLRQRSSNTSLRSTASYRAPPHPLNTQPPIRPAPHSRSASTIMSPEEFDIRRSMHHPPVAPPVINTESAEGHTWDIPEDLEGSVATIRPPPPVTRRDSTTSQRSLRAIFQPTSSKMQNASTSGPSASSSSHSSRDRNSQLGGPGPARRMTAMEAAAAAAKLNTTNNPALYHQSLGHSPSAAETAHLISRFLPPKKSNKPSWNVTPEMMQDGQPHFGLTEGDYRDAHDSLIRQMRDLSTVSTSRRQDRRTSRLPVGFGPVVSSAGTTVKGKGKIADNNVGVIKTRNGPLTVSRGGGWGGKTPFELGVERCLAQRPKTAGWGQ